MKKINKTKTKSNKEQTFTSNTSILAFDGYFENLNVFRDKDRYFVVLELNGDAETVNEGIMNIVSDLDYDITVQVLMCNYELEIADTIQIPIIPNDPLIELRKSYGNKIKEYNQNLNSVSHDTYVVISIKGYIDDVLEKIKYTSSKTDLFHFKRLTIKELQQLICRMSFQEFVENKKTIKKQIGPKFKSNETYLQFKNKYVRMLTIQLFSNNIYPELLTQIMTVSPDLMCSTFLKRVNKDKCLEVIDSIKEQNNKSIIQKKLSEEQDFYHCSIFIAVVADDIDKINSYTKIIKSICRKYYISISELYHQQTSGYGSLLPFGICKIPSYKVIDSMDVQSTIAKQVDPAKRGCVYGLERYSKKLLLYDRKDSGYILADDLNIRSQVIMNEIKNILVMYPNDKVVIIGKNADRYVHDLKYSNIQIKNIDNKNCPSVLTGNKLIDQITMDNLISSLFSNENRLNINYLNMIKRITNNYSSFDLDNMVANCLEDKTVEAEGFYKFLKTDLGQKIFRINSIDLTNKISVFNIKDFKFSNIYVMAVLNSILYNAGLWIFLLDVENLYKNDVDDYLSAYIANTKNILTLSGNPKYILKNKKANAFIKYCKFCNIFGLDVKQRIEVGNIFNFTKDQLALISESESDKGILCIPSGNYEYTKIDF